tara:strand:+ start:141 stop:257 length:117 start_codon:yes stop_codon:yes gene_type:complete
MESPAREIRQIVCGLACWEVTKAAPEKRDLPLCMFVSI